LRVRARGGIVRVIHTRITAAPAARWKAPALGTARRSTIRSAWRAIRLRDFVLFPGGVLMSSTAPAPRRNLYFALAALVVVSGVLSAADLGNQPYAGYQTDGDNTVTLVPAGSPAADAGMQVGDRIRSIGGIAAEDVKSLARQPRAAIGEIRVHEVERAGAVIPLDVRFASAPGALMFAIRIATLLGLCFVGFTLWAYLTAPGLATSVLAVYGFSFGLPFVGIPYISNYTMRMLSGIVVLSAILMGFALLLHYLLLFTRRDEVGVSAPSPVAVYGPAALVTLFFAVLTLLQPDATSGLNSFVRLLFGVFVVGYFVACLVVLVRGYTRASAAERAETGLGLMLLGAVVGLVPLMVNSLITTVAPLVVLPGSQYYFLTLGLIPITFGLAAVRKARRGGYVMA
jgi:membrane-associated protease RseP (regulator of RpoE activity)